MEITFDDAKNVGNQQKHGLSLSMATWFDWSNVRSQPDCRFDYGELREIGFGIIGERLYCVVFCNEAIPCTLSACAKPIIERFAIMSVKPKLIMPSEEEDVEINRGIAADPDTFEVSAEQMKRMKPLGARGRPKSATPKLLVSVRYDADIIEAFKTVGTGWQTKMNDALREWLQTHRPT